MDVVASGLAANVFLVILVLIKLAGRSGVRRRVRVRGIWSIALIVVVLPLLLT